MHENPLLPNAKLQELYALMQRARVLSKPPASAPRFEAILAATLMHVQPGDFVGPPQGPAAPALLAAERTKTPTPTTRFPPHQRLATVAGIAHGLHHSAAGRLAVYYADAGPSSARTEEGWAEALTYATRASLPLILVCADIPTARRATNPKALTWPSLSKLARSLQLPVLAVDGADAVAVYRCMQESAHRARLGDGPAVLWCALARPADRSPATDPLLHMRRYLAARNLLPASTTRKRAK